MTESQDYEGKERRRATRAWICVATAAECDAWTNLCHTKDFSETGIFLMSQKIPSMSVGFSLKIRIPDGQRSVNVRAKVVRVHGDNPRGFAAEFVDPPEAGIARIRNAVSHWEDLINKLQT